MEQAKRFNEEQTTEVRKGVKKEMNAMLRGEPNI
jgi:hypothetical protein